MSYTAASIMNRNVIAIDRDAPALRIAELLIDSGMGVAPVCAKDGALLGVVDEEHLLRPLGAVSALHLVWWLNRNGNELGCGPNCLRHIRLDHAKAWEVMNRSVVTAQDSMPLAALVKLWAAQRGRPLPILRDGRYVGLVGSAEVAAALALLADEDCATASKGGADRETTAVADRETRNAA